MDETDGSRQEAVGGEERQRGVEGQGPKWWGGGREAERGRVRERGEKEKEGGRKGSPDRKEGQAERDTQGDRETETHGD